MEPPIPPAFALTPPDLAPLLAGERDPFPEFAAARRDLAALRDAPRTGAILAASAPLIADLAAIPQTTYSRRRAFARSGDRAPYEAPYFGKRERLHAAALRLLLGAGDAADLRDHVHDYLWSICEETTWVIPAHSRAIDLMAAETAFGLAEIVALLGPALDAEVRRRVCAEIDRRVLDPFLTGNYDLRWFHGGDNWNGVCAGAIGGTFLYLEREPTRLAEGLALVLGSLRAYLDAAFEADGSSTEGVGYWQYGLHYVIIFAELVRARSGGAIDLLAAPRLRQIAAFPGALRLPGGRFASFADSPERVPLVPGLIARLAARAEAPALLGALAPPAPLAPPHGLSVALRDLLWWDGARAAAAPLADALLPAAGIARLVAALPDGTPVVAAIKAGHNGEGHNHNDIGSFILAVGDEIFLADPGPGRYDRDYFADRRYDNPLANSYGHGVPRIGGRLQGTGRDFAGTLLAAGRHEAAGQTSATLEFARAYPIPALASARRNLALATTGPDRGTALLRDHFRFADAGQEVEEALITRLPATLDGPTATIHGQRHRLRLTIDAPAGARFALAEIAATGRDDPEPATLRRLHVVLPPAAEIAVRIRMAAECLAPGQD